MITLCELCGTAITKLYSQTCSCPTIIDTNVTNEQNVLIAKVICTAIVVVAAIAALSFLLYNVIKGIHENIKDSKKREWEKENRESNRKTELQSKLLEHLKEEIDSYDKIPKLIAKLDEIQRAFADVEGSTDKDTCSKMQKQVNDLYSLLFQDKIFWQNLLKQYKDGTITINAKPQKDAYSEKIIEYLGETPSK